ncbi:MAG: CARDB domain-containing protein [Gemmatimonadota bacterium]
MISHRHHGLFRAVFLLAGLTACGASSKDPTGAGGGVGSLMVTISGLPAGAAARVTLAGPAGYTHTFSTSGQLSGLLAGSYTMSALYVSYGGQTYAPSAASSGLVVLPNDVAQASVAYATGSAPTIDYTIPGIQIVQSSQRPDNSVPLVAGRAAFVRVFVTANASTTSAPTVRLRLFQGATLVDSFTIAPTGNFVPLQPDTATLSSSWNVSIPANRMTPNLSIQAEVDPGDQIPETDETNNHFPSSSPMSLDVRVVAPLHLRFVPVVQSGLTGNVSNTNADGMLDLTRRMWPIGTSDWDVRQAYTSTAGPLQSGDGNGAWGIILSELSALRAADASTRNYYGVVGTTYNSGVAGYGYIGAPAAIGWDKGSSAGDIAVHELGHNFGRQHAPCGTTPFDINYPYAGAIIGVYGYDQGTGVLKSPSGNTDVMSYCSPNWVSDYNYEAVFSARGAGPRVVVSTTTAQQGLLVWGRITRDSLVLEPAFTVIATPSLPSRPGRFRLSGTDASGAALFSLSFDGDEVESNPHPGVRHFAFVIPLDSLGSARLSALRLSSGRLSAQRVATFGTPGAQGAPLPSVRVTSVSAGMTSLQWSATYPMALVRDARTSNILSFARGGRVTLQSTGPLTVELSNGLGSSVAARNLVAQ